MSQSLPPLGHTRALNSFGEDERARAGPGSDLGRDPAATFESYKLLCFRGLKFHRSAPVKPGTTNIRPSLPGGEENRRAFVRSLDSRERIWGHNPDEWGLDPSSSSPRCSFSLGPLVCPKRRETTGLSAAKPWGPRPGLEPQCLGKAVCVPAARPQHTAWEGRRGCGLAGASPPPQGGRKSSPAEPAPLAGQPIPRSPHTCLLAVDSRPLAPRRTVAGRAGQKSGGNTRVVQAPSCFSKNHRPPKRRTTRRGLHGAESCIEGREERERG